MVSSLNFKNFIRKCCFVYALVCSLSVAALPVFAAMSDAADAQTPATTDNSALSPADLVKQQQAVVNGYKDQLKELLKNYDSG